MTKRYYLFIIAILFLLSICHCERSEAIHLLANNSWIASSQAPRNDEFSDYQSFKPLKMVFLPDTHVSFKDEDGWILYKESFVIFQDVMKSIKTVPELDFVVFGGDLTHNDDNALSDLPLFLDSIEDIGVKYFAILGDRDADLKDSYTKHDFCAEFRRNGFDNPELTYWVQQLNNNTLLIGLDTSIENKFEGKLAPEQLLWLDNTLKANSDKFIMIVMHHPAFQATASDKTVWKRFVLENSDEFLKIINKYPQVKLILSGHHHNYAVKNIAGKLFISLPSVVTYPNSYKILKIYPDRVEVENKDISFKQIIKKAKNILVKTSYARKFNIEKPQKILNFQEGDKISKTKIFYY